MGNTMEKIADVIGAFGAGFNGDMQYVERRQNQKSKDSQAQFENFYKQIQIAAALNQMGQKDAAEKAFSMAMGQVATPQVQAPAPPQMGMQQQAQASIAQPRFILPTPGQLQAQYPAQASAQPGALSSSPQAYAMQQMRANADPIAASMNQMGPISGSVTPTGKTTNYGQTPAAQLAQKQAESKIQTDKEATQRADKIGEAVKMLVSVQSDFNRAFPSHDRTPFEQRIAGALEQFGADKGARNNPEAKAMNDLLKSYAINIVKLIGESGNLATSDIETAVKAIEGAGLTGTERFTKAKMFAKTHLVKMSSAAKLQIAKDPEVASIMKTFDIDLSIEADLNNLLNGSRRPTSDEVTRARAILAERRGKK